jgi:hypothetical protein
MSDKRQTRPTNLSRRAIVTTGAVGGIAAIATAAQAASFGNPDPGAPEFPDRSSPFARSPTPETLRYALNHWDGLQRFLEDGTHRGSAGTPRQRLASEAHRRTDAVELGVPITR